MSNLTGPAALMAAAAAACGRELTQPTVLTGGHETTVVLRCQDLAGGTVVVKAYPETAEGASGFAAEAAGLACATGSGLSPDFLGADVGRQAVVMADLGGGASLADVLLGDCPERARTALLDWAAAYGRLSAAVTPARDRFDALQGSYLAGRPDERHSVTLARRILAVGENAAKVGVTAPPGLATELAEVAAAADAGTYVVFSAGDLCPDNNVLTGRGVAFLDFEEAGFHPAFLDAAYLRMPFSTCWCAFRLPAELIAAAELAYREQVSQVWPELADDDVWQPGARRAVTAWTLSATSWLLRRALAADVPMQPGRPSPGARQLIRYRWQALLPELAAAGEFPAIASLLRSLLAATESWQAPDLPLYPALRAA